MIKHTALSSVFTGLLVASLMYWISPGEVTMVWLSFCNRVSTEADLVLSETLNPGAVEQLRNLGVASSPTSGVVRKITPDPFRRFGPGGPSPANGFLAWLRGPEPVAVWLCMAALAVAGKYAVRRRCKVAVQQRMALTLSKAVRQM